MLRFFIVLSFEVHMYFLHPKIQTVTSSCSHTQNTTPEATLEVISQQVASGLMVPLAQRRIKKLNKILIIHAGFIMADAWFQHLQ